MAVQREFADGEVVPGTRYRIMRPLGAGGMGSVYLVEHVELGKRFVLKALFREFASRKDLVARLRQEWRALARLDNPNIINVTDAGTSDNGVPFYVMERVEGETLSELLARDHALGIPRAIAIATSVLDGLSAAHEIGIVHRDVKPPNIFVVQGGGVKLLDFGIAKLADQSSEVITARGLAIGTPRHMSPEQARGKAVDARADLYAVGLVLFEMIAGQGPFDDARDANEMLIAHLTSPPPKLSSQHRAVEPALDEIVDSLLKKEPAERPKSAREVASRLRAILLKKASVPTPIVQTPTQRIEETPAAATRREGAAPAAGATLIQPVSAAVESITEPGAPPSSVQRAEATQQGMEWAKDGFDTHVSAGDGAMSTPTASVDSEEVTAVPRASGGHTLRLGEVSIPHPADVETRTAVPAAEPAPALAPLGETPPPVSAHLPPSSPAKPQRSLVPLVIAASAVAAMLAVASLVALKALGGASSEPTTALPASPPPAPAPPPPSATPVEKAAKPVPREEPATEPATTASAKVVESARPISKPVAEAPPKPAEPKVKPAETATPPAPKPTAKPGKLPSSGL
jgi:serine/threonine protein kinase